VADLCYLEGHDIFSFVSIKLNLHKQGLVWIGGNNLDTDAALNNGCGKSNVFRLIQWAAFGETVDEDDPNHVIRVGSSLARTVLEIVDGSVKWVVGRQRRKSGPKLSLYRDGVKQSGSRGDLQHRIDQLLGLDFLAFRNTVMYAQRDTKRFCEPGVTDAERKEVLQRVLRTAVYGSAKKWIDEQLALFRKQQAELSAEARAVDARLEENDVDGLQAEHDAWEEGRAERLGEARTAAAKGVENVKKLRAARPNIDVLETAVSTAEALKHGLEKDSKGLPALEKDAAALWKDCNAAQVSMITSERRAQGIDQQLTDLEGLSACPTCTSSLVDGKGHDHIQSLRSSFETATDEWHDCSTRYQALKDQLQAAEKLRDTARKAKNALSGAVESVSKAREAVTKARQYDERLSNAEASARDALARAKAILAESNPHTTRLTAARLRAETLDVEQRRLAEQEDDLAREMAHYDFWTRGFGPSGLPSFVLDRWMPYLAERANHYLEVLSDGDINVFFSTQRALKSGDVRDEIGIQWTIEGMEGYPPSGGQFRKITLATDLGLMDLSTSREGACLDLLCLDECLDGLDAEGRQRVLLLLHSLRSSRGTILVISHDTGIAEVFERAYMVTKQFGISTLESK
jgi:DNA repair exonuclease SbcCD ATPase subunit